jgi:glutamate--cysteine ligase
VRPRGYFEVRSIDAVPQAQWPAALALLTGLTYDPVTAAVAAEIVGDPDDDLLERAGRLGLGDAALGRMASELATVALSGCRRLGSSFLAEHHLGAAIDFFTTLTT